MKKIIRMSKIKKERNKLSCSWKMKKSAWKVERRKKEGRKGKRERKEKKKKKKNDDDEGAASAPLPLIPPHYNTRIRRGPIIRLSKASSHLQRNLRSSRKAAKRGKRRRRRRRRSKRKDRRERDRRMERKGWKRVVGEAAGMGLRGRMQVSDDAWDLSRAPLSQPSCPPVSWQVALPPFMRASGAC